MNCLGKMRSFVLRFVFIFATLQRSRALPETVMNSCEGDILLLLDSSGSVTNFEFARFLLFSADLLLPFSLGRGHIRVALLQVSTKPHLEFGLDDHSNQDSLQRALSRVRQLQGDTNTEAAIRMAEQLLLKSEQSVPKLLLWLTDGVQPGTVEKPMSELRSQGVSVLVVFMTHGNYNVLKRVVTPPVKSHLYSVDITSISVITEDLREAITRIICAERLTVVELTSHSAVLQWHPVLTSDSGYYDLRYNSVSKTQPEIRITQPGDSSQVELTNLQPETSYTASLQPESNEKLFRKLSVNFTTLPKVLSPAEVSLSDSGPHQIRVNWGPLQPGRVQRYTLEYGAIPSGRVHVVTLPNQQSSVLLTDLEPGTQYLVTVSALHVDGKERTITVKACTQEVEPPALANLQLISREQQEDDEVQAEWQANEQGLKGYWVTWDKKTSQRSTSQRSHSSIFLPPKTPSIQVTKLAPNSRICVSPVYSTGRGAGICCTARKHRD